jgi:hypothetical protein
MRSRIETSEMMQSASDIWTFLKTRGGLDTKIYDASLVEELRSRLSLPPTGRFEKQLKTKNISTEDFVIAFFKAIQPYAEMMTDLLRMFEEAGAKQTNRNLAIRFQFNQHLPELSFDLSHFRNWVETWARVSSTYLGNLWNFDTIWALNGALRGWNVEIRRRTKVAI